MRYGVKARDLSLPKTPSAPHNTDLRLSDRPESTGSGQGGAVGQAAQPHLWPLRCLVARIGLRSGSLLAASPDRTWNRRRGARTGGATR